MYTFLVWLTNKSAEHEWIYLFVNYNRYAGRDEGKEKVFKTVQFNQLSVCLFLGACGRGQRGWEHQHLGVHEGQVRKAGDHPHSFFT